MKFLGPTAGTATLFLGAMSHKKGKRHASHDDGERHVPRREPGGHVPCVVKEEEERQMRAALLPEVLTGWDDKIFGKSQGTLSCFCLHINVLARDAHSCAARLGRREALAICVFDFACVYIKSVMLVLPFFFLLSQLSPYVILLSLFSISNHLQISITMSSSGWFQNIPVVSRLFGWQAPVDGQETKEAAAESPYPDYMLDPDAVVSVLLLCSAES